MDWLDRIAQFWPHLVAAFDVLAVTLSSVHILLNKRDHRAATLWLGIVWLMPVIGALLYLVFGVNRLRRRAVTLGVHKTFSRPVPENLGEPRQNGAEHLQQLAKVVNRVVALPLTDGNKIEPLINGDEAFPAMLAAIAAARKSITLCSYIFDNDPSGREFVAALKRAIEERGVKIRVLVDAAGTRYSWPPITWKLRRAGVPHARFLPSSIFQPWRVATINLRNHRKLLVVDGQTAFTGGMNIRQGNLLATRPKSPVQDLHFRITGPIVAQLQESFANDWAFTTREILDGKDWFPDICGEGNVIARVITDGPDADFDKLRLTLLAALAEAQESVQIITPYFLPDIALISALNLAALRGVRVDIILPAQNNLPFVDWASRALWWQVLERGCRLWLTPGPFDHSKLMIVDGHWVTLGSANWDARSLRLNFELNVECYGREFAQAMQAIVDLKRRGAQEITLATVNAYTVPVRLRNALLRLFSPFL